MPLSDVIFEETFFSVSKLYKLLKKRGLIMEKKLFSVFFLLIPILSVILLTTLKLMLRSDDFWSAFESSLPMIIFYYLSISVLWVINFDKIKKKTNFHAK